MRRVDHKDFIGNRVLCRGDQSEKRRDAYVTERTINATREVNGR